jgi:hypothetical protein
VEVLKRRTSTEADPLAETLPAAVLVHAGEHCKMLKWVHVAVQEATDEPAH